MGEDREIDPESLTLDAAILRSHKSLSNILNSGSPGALTPSSGLFPTNPNPVSSTFSPSSKASSSSSLHVPNPNAPGLSPRRSNSNLRGSAFANTPGERISFMNWSPPSSSASSAYGDGDAYDTNEYGENTEKHGQAFGAPSNTSSRPAGPPHQAPSSELTPSFWLVADPNANPLARVGADEPLPSPADEVDIAIIGSGITGVSFLYNLVRILAKRAEEEPGNGEGKGQKPFTIVMLEARDFCSGATGRNGGHLTPSIFDDFVDRSNYPIPEAIDDALRVALLEQHTLSSLRDLIVENGWAKDIDFVENGHIKLFGAEGIEEGKKEEEEARKDWEAAKQAGLPESITGKVRWIGEKEMREIYGVKEGNGVTGCWFPAANVWPIKLVTKIFRLAETIVSNSLSSSSPISLQLFTHTTVTSVAPFSLSTSYPAERSTSVLASSTDSPDQRWTIHTSRGQINTRCVVHATNAYASYLLPQFAPPSPSNSPAPPISSSDTSSLPIPIRVPEPESGSKPRAQWIQPTRGQVIATRAAHLSSSELWPPGPSWLANRGYEYWFPRYWLPRPSVEGNEKEKALVILGGARDRALGGEEGAGENSNPLEAGIIDDSTLNPHISDALQTFLPDVFPGLFDAGNEPEYEWTGIMGYTKTLDPIVGPVPSAPVSSQQTQNQDQTYLSGQFIAAGYSGHGMPRAYACAEALAEMVVADMSSHYGVASEVGASGIDWETWKREKRPDWLPASYLTF